MTALICGIPFLLFWFGLGGIIIRNGARAIQDRKIIYRVPHPTGTLVATMKGDAVRVLGVCQIIVGGLLILSLVGVVINSEIVNAVFGIAFVISLPVYYGIIRLSARWLDVVIRNVLR